jgi:hypothetical protein
VVGPTRVGRIPPTPPGRAVKPLKVEIRTARAASPARTGVHIGTRCPIAPVEPRPVAAAEAPARSVCSADPPALAPFPLRRRLGGGRASSFPRGSGTAAQSRRVLAAPGAVCEAPRALGPAREGPHASQVTSSGGRTSR